jgi:uncharacterized protein DUF4440
MSRVSRIPIIAATALIVTAPTWAAEVEDEQAIIDDTKSVWEQIAAKDFTHLMIGPRGVVHAGSAGGLWRRMTAEEMAAYLAESPNLRAAPYHINVRFLGSQKDVAYVTYYLVGTVVRGDGGCVSYRTRASSVMEKIDGEWVSAGQHYSPLFGGSGFGAD